MEEFPCTSERLVLNLKNDNHVNKKNIKFNIANMTKLVS